MKKAFHWFAWIPALAIVSGLCIPLLVRLVGALMPSAYDSWVLPILYYFVLPNLAGVALGAAVLAMMRGESLRAWPAAMVALGAAVSIPVTNDWWYFQPAPVATLVIVVAWQVRLKLWSCSREAGLVAGLLIAIALIRAAVGWNRGIGFDARFGIGFPVWYEALLRVAIIFLPLGLLAFWIMRLSRRSVQADREHIRYGEQVTRSVFGAFLDLEPRCATYLRASAILTRCAFDDPDCGGGRRVLLRSCARPALTAASAFPKDPCSPWTKFCVRTVRALMECVPLLSPIRLLRPAATVPGHPSQFVRGMLEEGAKYEAAEAMRVLFDRAPEDWMSGSEALTAKQKLETWQIADLHFGRHVQFREALIDARHLLFLQVSGLEPKEWKAKVKDARTRLGGALVSETAQAPSEASTHLREAGRAMLALWLDALEWRFFEFGDKMVEAGCDCEVKPLVSGRRSSVSLAQLTCNLLALRETMRARGVEPDSVYAAAGDLGLWLLVGALETPGKGALSQMAADANALKRYLDRIGSNPKNDQALSVELRIAGVGYALFCLSVGDWQDAPRAFVADPGSPAGKEPEMVWLERVGGLAHAGFALGQFRANSYIADEACRKTHTIFGEIDRSTFNPLPEALPISTGLRSFHFVYHLKRAAESAGIPAMSFVRQLIDTVRKIVVPGIRVAPFSPEGIREAPRAPIRTALFLWGAFLGVVAALYALAIGNPIARVRDARLSTQYNNKPLTALAAGDVGTQVWVGSDGGGIRVFQPSFQLFLPDLTHESTAHRLIGDHVLGLDFRGPLAAIAATDGPGRAGGAQVASIAGAQVDFWAKPCVDLSTFPGVRDEIATSVAEWPNHEHLAVGTRGSGLGIYDVLAHSWISILRAPNELPSDNITDLGILKSGGNDLILWVATDRGLCAGGLTSDGRFVWRWSFGLAEGLAGEDIKELKIEEGYVWYRTDGHGLGRIAIDPTGAPISPDSHELLVSERKIDRIADNGLRLATGSPAGSSTWFLAETASKHLIGRYREAPHDTFGTALPDDFPFEQQTCIAAEADRGLSVIVGTEDGAWLFKEQRIDGAGTPTYNKLSEIRGGKIGPEGQRVEEAALTGNMAVVKTKASEAPHALLKTEIGDFVTTSAWRTLVGAGRFQDLSLRDITAAAESGRRVYFGTSGKGIGVWDPASLEVRREYFVGAPSPGKKLRNDVVLDLGSAEGLLFQVTGDYGLDVIGGPEPSPLIPSDSAPFSADQLATAAASGTRLAAAGGGHIGIYDARTFGWKELPPLNNVAQLFMTKGALWGLTRNGDLQVTTGSMTNWRLALSRVIDLSTTSNGIQVLASGQNGINGLFTFAGDYRAKPVAGQNQY